MAYSPRTWVDRQVERPKTYNLQENGDGSVTLLPAEGIIIEAGTPLIADNMNQIEEGLEEVSIAVGDGVNDYIRQPAFAVTAGTSTAYTVTLDPAPNILRDGFGITIVPHVTNGANATLNINGLGGFPLKKQNGLNYTAGRLIVGKPYTFRKVGPDFLADSAGGSGTAQPAHVLAPYTFTNDDSEEYTGTMVTITSGEDPALGVGQWPNGDLAVYPRQGYRKGGSGAGEIRVTTAQLQSADGEFRADRFLEGNNVFGMNGNIPNLSARDHHMPGISATVWSGDRFFIQPPRGYFSGDSWVTFPVPGLVPNNVRAGIGVAGMVGNMREYFGGAFPLNFNSPGPGTPVGGYYEIFRIPGGYTNISFAGRISMNISSFDTYQKMSFVIQDIYGNELGLLKFELTGSSDYAEQYGMFVDRVNRQITTVFGGSGYPDSHGGWSADTDIGMNGTFSKPFDMNNQIIAYFKVEASLGGGFTSMSMNGKLAYN